MDLVSEINDDDDDDDDSALSGRQVAQLDWRHVRHVASCDTPCHTCKRQDQSCATKAPGVTPHLATSHGARVMKVAYSNTLHKIWLDYVQSLTDVSARQGRGL